MNQFESNQDSADLADILDEIVSQICNFGHKIGHKKGNQAKYFFKLTSYSNLLVQSVMLQVSQMNSLIMYIAVIVRLQGQTKNFNDINSLVWIILQPSGNF